MTIQLCLNTSTIKPQPTLEKIRLAAEAGFDAIELWVSDVYDHIARGGEVKRRRAAAGQGRLDRGPLAHFGTGKTGVDR